MIDSTVHVRLSDRFHGLLEIPAKEIARHVSFWFHLSDYHHLEVSHMHIDLANQLKKIKTSCCIISRQLIPANTLLLALTLGIVFCTKEEDNLRW